MIAELKEWWARLLMRIDVWRGFPPRARGRMLDCLAATLGVDRLEGESDPKLRARTLNFLTFRGGAP